jgi:site-specific recombinase XerC
MSTNLNPTDALRTMIQALDLSAADLAQIVDAMTAESTIPTVGEFVAAATDACPRPSLPTYSCHFRRLADAHGDRRLDEITTADINALRNQIVATAARAKVDRSKAAGRQLHSYEYDAHGHSAGENLVRAARFFFNVAVEKRLIVINPAAAAKVPRRLPDRRRPLTATELDQVGLTWCSSGNDPELDSLLFEFHRKTAARREGGINLRLGNLDRERGSVTVTEKFGQWRELPLDVDLLVRLEAFARSRGAAGPADAVFRNRNGKPITRKRYETIYGRLRAALPWTQPLGVGVHFIRHTTLDDIRVVSDLRVAEAYAGHSDTAGSTIMRYSKVTFGELAAAYETIFGSRHSA